jgi:hypothetical protein
MNGRILTDRLQSMPIDLTPERWGYEDTLMRILGIEYLTNHKPEITSANSNKAEEDVI